jgi:hypothetical protein
VRGRGAASTCEFISYICRPERCPALALDYGWMARYE